MKVRDMHMKSTPLRAFLILAISGFTASPASAQGLTGQRVQGLERVCTYRRSGRSTGPARETRIGLGQPCPPFYRRPPATPVGIPALATLVRTSRAGGRTECIYGQAGREYRRLIAQGALCPFSAR